MPQHALLSAPTRARWSLAAPLLALALSCTCDDPTYRVSTPDMPDAGGADAADANAGDADASPDDADAAACDGPLEAVALETLPQRVSWNTPAPYEVFIDQGHVYFHDTAPDSDTSHESVEVWRVRPGQRPEQLTDNNHPDTLIDVRDGAQLLVEGPLRGGASEYRTVYIDGAQRQLIAAGDASSVALQRQTWDARARSVDRHPTLHGAIAPWDARARSVERGAVLLYTALGLGWWTPDAEPRPLTEPNARFSFPTLLNGRAAWLEYPTDVTRVMAWDSRTPDLPPRALKIGDRASPYALLLGQTRVFWADARGVTIYYLNTDAQALLHEGECALHDADADGVLFACFEEDRSMTLWRYADDTLTRVRQAPSILSGRLRGARAVWAEYDTIDAWCSGPVEGRIMLAVHDGPAETIAPVSSGCWCCGAYWPPLSLDFDGTTVAWNYAVVPSGEVGYGVGYASLTFEPCAP